MARSTCLCSRWILAVHWYPTVTRIPGACSLPPRLHAARWAPAQYQHDTSRSATRAPRGRTRRRQGYGASSMVDEASSSSRAHGRRRRNIWLQRSGAGARAVNQYGHGRRRRNMAAARERERKQSGLLARACSRRAAHAPPVHPGRCELHGQWVSVGEHEDGSPIRRSGVTPNEDGSTAALR